MKLECLKDMAYRAYSGTSFDPEKRRDTVLKDLEEELLEDLKEIGEDFNNYESKYINFVSTWLARKSRCISPMITGSANFPVRKNQKANTAVDNAWDAFRKWRKRYIKAVNRISNLSPEDDMQEAINKVDKLIIRQEVMKATNKIIKNKTISNQVKIDQMIEAGLSEKSANTILEPNCMGTIGFASYTLTNNNAKIKAAKNKILTMINRITIKTAFKPIPFEGGRITIDNDHVCITHDVKPDREVINKIKSRGFHWSRNYGSWNRKHTANALHDAKEIITGT